MGGDSAGSVEELTSEWHLLMTDAQKDLLSFLRYILFHFVNVFVFDWVFHYLAFIHRFFINSF